MTVVNLDIVNTRVRKFFSKAYEEWFEFTVLTILLTPLMVILGVVIGFFALTAFFYASVGRDVLEQLTLEQFIYFLNWLLAGLVAFFAIKIAWQKRHYLQYFYSTIVTLVFALFAYVNLPYSLLNSFAPLPLIFLYLIFMFLLLGFATAGERHFPLGMGSRHFLEGSSSDRHLENDVLAVLLSIPWTVFSSYRDIWNFSDRNLSDKDCFIAAEILMVIPTNPPGFTLTQLEEQLSMYDGLSIERILSVLVENDLLGTDEKNGVVSYYRSFEGDKFLSSSYLY